MKVNITGQSSAGGTITVQEEGVTQSSSVTTLNFVGANVTASGAGAVETITITGGAGSFAVTETEIDFGSTPVTEAKFTVTDAAISSSSKIMCTQSGNVATGRVGADSLWDSIDYTALGETGSFTLYAKASGYIIGKRKVFYTYS